jgi:hypothetical protein
VASSRKSVAAVPAEVTLNLSSASVPCSIFAVSLATTVWADYFWLLRLGIGNLFSDNFAAVRAVYNFVLHAFSPLPVMLKEKRGCAGDSLGRHPKTAYKSLYHGYIFIRFFLKIWQP